MGAAWSILFRGFEEELRVEENKDKRIAETVKGIQRRHDHVSTPVYCIITIKV